MALPRTIETDVLRQVRVQRADNSYTTLYDVAEAVHAGTFRLQEAGTARNAAVASTPVVRQAEVNGRTVTVTVEVA